MEDNTSDALWFIFFISMVILFILGFFTFIFTYVFEIELNYFLFIPSIILLYLLIEFLYISGERGCSKKDRDSFPIFLVFNGVVLILSMIVSNGIVGVHNGLGPLWRFLVDIFPVLKDIATWIAPLILVVALIILFKYAIYHDFIMNYKKPRKRRKGVK